MQLADTSQPSVSALDAAALPRHRWYFFKEAFSPAIVRHAIGDARCGLGDLVVDPFSGSGTTALVAAELGCDARASEVNPFLAFVSRTKLVTPPISTLDLAAETVLKAAKKPRASYLSGYSTFTAREGAHKWLFNDSVLEAFEGGWYGSATVPTRARGPIRLALLTAAMDTSNAVRDGKCLRYRSDWKERQFSATDFRAALESRIGAIREDVRAAPIESGLAQIRVGDSRFGGVAGRRKFKLCVMSPPYLNSFDYTDVYRPELFLGRFVADRTSLRRLRLSSVRSHVQVKWAEPSGYSFGSHFDNAYEAIALRADRLWNVRLPKMLKAYFEDMRKILKSLREEAAEGAAVWIVVSTSAYAGIEIPVDLILADVGCQVGWSLREVRALRHLRRVPVQQWTELAAAARDKVQGSERSHDGPHLRESLIILDAKARK